MGDLKESKQAVGATLLTELADFAPPTILSQAGRLQSRQRFFNMVVTNVPGPQFPLYLMGRELQALYPMVPLAKRQAVCFGIMSYNGQVNFGLIGDYEAMADLDSLAHDLTESLAELKALAPAKGKAKSKQVEARRPGLQARVSLTIREAEPGDAEAIAAIHDEAVLAGNATLRTEPRPLEEVRAVLGQGHPFLVAEDGRSRSSAGRPPGRTRSRTPTTPASARPPSTWPGSARGQGAGQALLGALAERAAAANTFKLVAKVFTTNEASLRLFERAGYTQVGTHIRHGRLRGEWKDVVVLEKLLGEAAG